MRYSSQSVNSGGFVNDGRKEAFVESYPKVEQTDVDGDRDLKGGDEKDEEHHIQDDSGEVEDEIIIESVPILGGGGDENDDADSVKKDEDKGIRLEDLLKEEGDEVIIEDVPILGVQGDVGEHLTFAVDEEVDGNEANYESVNVTDGYGTGKYSPSANLQDSLTANDTSELKTDSL